MRLLAVFPQPKRGWCKPPIAGTNGTTRETRAAALHLRSAARGQRNPALPRASEFRVCPEVACPPLRHRAKAGHERLTRQQKSVSLRAVQPQPQCPSGLNPSSLAASRAHLGRVFRLFKQSLLFVFVTLAASCDHPAMTGPPSRQQTVSVDDSLAHDRSILTELFNSTGGVAWINNADWLSGRPLHEWFGVYARNGRVVSLDLPDNNLTGPLPAALANLDSLTTLDLSENNLTGSIPAELGSAPRLRDLFLHDNQLSSSLPEALSHADSLQYLVLSRNQGLRGPLPLDYRRLNLQSFLADSTALCLPETLNAWYTNIPRRSLLPACETSAADRAALVSIYNALQGPRWNNKANWLTDAPLQRWHGVQVDQHGRVVELTLNNNRLTGVLSEHLWTLTALTNLELYSNNIIGYIPPGIGTLSQLTNLELDGNELTGPLPSELFTLTQLTNVELERNQLTGRLPSSIGHLKALTRLELYANRLGGPLPPELGELTNLTTLALSQNNFHGAIPSAFGDLTKLTTLVLSQNALTDSIPSTFGNLANLAQLYLHGNQLSHVSVELGKLTALRILSLYDNLINGPIPSAWGKMASLRILDLGDNQFSGPIPPALGDLANLQELHLSDNVLTGTLPPELGNLGNLSWLNVNRNKLSGALPPELAVVGSAAVTAQAPVASEAMSVSDPRHEERERLGLGSAITGLRGATIGALDLSGNKFSGRLPDEWGTMRHLAYLNLEDNGDLSGVLPESFAGLLNMRRLYIRGTGLCLGYDSRSQQWAADLMPAWGLRRCTRREVEGLLLDEIYEDMDGGGWSDAKYWGTNVSISSWRGSGCESPRSGRDIDVG